MGHGAACLDATAALAATLLDLPEECVHLVLQRCEVKELCAVRAACRLTRQAAGHASLWRAHARRIFDIDLPSVALPRRALAGPDAAGAFWRGVVSGLASTPPAPPVLRCRGVFTDGGCDDASRFWAVNLFKPQEWESYCSSASNNVHCIGLFEASAPDGTLPLDAAAHARRKFMIARCANAAWLMFRNALAGGGDVAGGPYGAVERALGAQDLRRWSSVELEGFFLELFRLAKQEPFFHKLMFAGVPADSVEAEDTQAHQLADTIHVEQAERRNAAAQEPMRVWSHPRTPEVMCTAGGVPSVPPVVSVVTRVAFSRVGNFSCPVQCGALLLGSVHTWPSETEAGGQHLHDRLGSLPSSRGCAALDDLTTVEAVQEASASGCLPPIAAIGALPGGVFVEFEPRGAGLYDSPGLYPVVWFSFIPRREARQLHVAHSRIDDFKYDQMDVHLARRHSGNVACVKLIKPENLMEEWSDDHEEPNIDMNSVLMWGNTVPL